MRLLSGDLWGGLAAMLVALPSSIAFGVTIFAPLGGALAAQGAMAGILGATALGLIASAVGGSPRLISAPCAPAAAVLSALAVGFAQKGMDAAAALLLLTLITLFAGLLQVALGAAGIGRLIKFIPFPVVSGYLSGVGLIIIGSQLPKLVGLPSAKLLETLPALPQWDWRSVLVGIATIAAMLLAPRLTRRVPAAIFALGGGVGAYQLLALVDPALARSEQNPLLIGTLTGGGANLGEAVFGRWQALGSLGLSAVLEITLPALTLALLLSIDTLKTCLVLDAMTARNHEPNRVLIGQGLGNLGAGLIGGVPGAGTMGATLINLSSGGRSRRAGLIAGGLALLAFLFLTPLIAWIPVAALAGILIVVGWRMIDRESLRFFYSPATRFDFFVILAVVLTAIFGNLIAASGMGIALAILLFIREQTRSTIVHNRIEGRKVFAKRAQVTRSYDELERLGATVDDTIVIELQGSLFFGTASQLQKALEPETTKRKYVILSMRRVQSLDVTATHVLEQIKDRLEARNAYLVFCDIPKHLPSGLKMKRFLKETGVVRPTEKAVAFRQLDQALEWVEIQEQAAGDAARQFRAVPLREMRLFSTVDDATLADFERTLEVRAIASGDKAFGAGQTSGELFLIRRGLVKVTVPVGDKESYHLATCGPGDVIGSLDFLEGKGHRANAVALVDAEVYVLSRDQFRALVKAKDPIAEIIAEHIARNLAHRLRVVIGELQAMRG